MPNPFFQFKQFTIHQQHCAMKVTTDGCLFGALVADGIAGARVHTLLDIGCGTGLLSLMAAQKTNAIIDAVEIGEAASKQAAANFNASPWKERLNSIHCDVLHLDGEKRYDAIISNPPFFANDLHSPDKQKNAAKHDTALTLDNLIDVTNRHLKEEGLFALLLPYNRMNNGIKAANERQLHLTKKILVKQTPSHDHFRAILFFNRKETALTAEEIMIKDDQGKYTPEFTALLKDYYLYL